jgi:hypothetical protein
MMSGAASTAVSTRRRKILFHHRVVMTSGRPKDMKMGESFDRGVGREHGQRLIQ